ncbi:hypothetical protein [Nitrosopumilus sp. S6]
MKSVLIIALAFVLFIPVSTFGAEQLSLYNEHGFSIEYPSEWEIVDTWDSTPNKVFFKSDYMGTSGISVVLSDKYELADLYDREFIEIKDVDQTLVDKIEENLETTCKINRHGPCWSFKLLDSKIITVNQEKSISIKYSAVMDDIPTTFRMLLIPDEDDYWFVVAKTIGNETNFELFEESINSFKLDSTPTPTIIKLQPTPTPIFQIPSDSDIVVERHTNVNLILIGDEWLSTAKSTISNNLPKYRDPIYVSSQEKTGVRHVYNYNFVSVSDKEVEELSTFLKNSSFQRPIVGSDLVDIPFWQAAWVAANHPEWVTFDRYGNVASYNIDYRLIDALATEEFIYEKFIGSNTELSDPDSVNLVFIAMDLDDADFLRNYSVTSRDDASGKEFSSMGLMGYGGNYNMLFFDLYAVPWLDLDIQTFEYAFPPWIESAHDCDSSQCVADLITFHTSEALQYVVSPHLLYPIKNAEQYVVNVLIYTKPGGQNTVTPQTLPYFVDEEKVKKELEFLYPFSDWEINFELERKDTRGLSYEFKKVLESTSHHTIENIYGDEKSLQILDVSKIQPYLISWAESKKSTSTEDTQIVPVLIEIDSSDKFDIYLDDFGVLGIAPSFPNSNESCCALGVTSQKKVWGEEIGFTDLLIHETGHALGLMHPFMSTNDFGDITVNEYFNWYSSPMTYSFPNAGCGLLFNLIFIDPCGNASLSFTNFERNMISDARLAFLWKETNSNLDDLSGQNLETASKTLQDSKNAYKNGDIYSLSGSLKLATEAHQSSKVSEKNSQLLSASVTSPKVPDWIKNNAKWWADGQIDDDSFVQGIQHLVKEKVISIPVSSETSVTASDGVPDWIKNNAKWWADGLIGEGDFLKGIEFLAKSGIIKVN